MACKPCQKKAAEAQKQAQIAQQKLDQDQKVTNLIESNNSTQLFAMARNLGLNPVSGTSDEALAILIIEHQSKLS